jgi:uncharacterized protein HemY
VSFLVIFRTNNSLHIKITLLFLVMITEFALRKIGSHLSRTSYIKCVFHSVNRRRRAGRHETLETLAHRTNIN